MALCDSHSGSHWLSLPLSGILWPSLAHYCSLISRIQPLIGSQGSCLALIADATMTHYVPLWSIQVVELTHKRNFNRHSKYKPAVVLGGVWWIVLSKGWRFSFGLCELIACFWHHIFFCAWPINMPSQTRAPLTRTKDIASQLEIRGQGQSAHTFMLIQSYSRKPERTMPDFRVTFHRWISKLKIFNFVKV